MAFNQKQSGKVVDGFYDAFRENGAPTYYGPETNPVLADVIEAGVIFAGSILALSFLLIVPGFKGKSKISIAIWVLVGIFVGTAIVVTEFSPHWETSEIEVDSKYKAGTGEEIKARIGLHIGLKGVNITLKGDPVHQLNETINYNEHFEFSTRQGLMGFGPFANNFNREFRAAQFRGLPLPILWIAEYFTLDGEGLRWGRLYREAGFYAGICLWISLGFWILANILVFLLLRYAAYMSILTGLTMGIAVVIKHYMRNVTDLVVPFSATHKLELQYGVAFWICLGTGGLCIFCGIVMFVVDLQWPRVIAAFFDVDLLQGERFQIRKEGSTVSGDSVSTNLTSLSSKAASSHGSELTDVIVDGQSRFATPSKVKLNHSKVAPAPVVVKPKTAKSDSFKGLSFDADWTGESRDWEDYSSESEVSNTDDEFDEKPYQNPKTTRQGRGLFSRFQKPRRVPLAKTSRRLNNSTSQRPQGRNLGTA